jgi:ubiquinone/menaquinone biosynthesis C-methylase UbiE
MSDTITEGTKRVLSVGCEVFQIFQLSSDEDYHSDKMLELSELPVGAKVMDVGCGIGALPRMWKTRRPDLEFVLVNNNEFQLSLCPREMQRVLCDAHEIPSELGPVDTILVHYTLGYLDLERAFLKFYDLLKEGGELQIYDMHGSDVRKRMKTVLGYNIHTSEVIELRAKQAGFDTVKQIDFDNTSKENFEKVLSLETQEVADLCRLALLRMTPGFWRFRKPFQSS